MADMTEIVNGNVIHVHADFPAWIGLNSLARQCIKIFNIEDSRVDVCG